MDEFLDLPTLIVIGVAIVVLFRLRSVLGTRTGNERSPLDRANPQTPATRRPDDPPAAAQRPLPGEPNFDDERRARKLETEIETYSHGSPDLAANLRAVIEQDPTFTPKSFIEGAKSAYEMILVAFAEGDKKTLKTLLDKDVYDGFEGAINAREASGQKVDFTFVGLPKIEISAAEADKRQVTVTVQFHAEVVSATRDRDGTLIEGNADQVQTIADEWTFARNPKSRDPNWKLIETNQLS